jgi:hydrogenase expression/formation protein HypC
MCLGVPGIVKSIDGDHAGVIIGEVTYKAGLHLVNDVEVGDYVLLHSGYVIEKLEKEDALETLKLFEELGVIEQSDETS